MVSLSCFIYMDVIPSNISNAHVLTINGPHRYIFIEADSKNQDTVEAKLYHFYIKGSSYVRYQQSAWQSEIGNDNVLCVVLIHTFLISKMMIFMTVGLEGLVLTL